MRVRLGAALVAAVAVAGLATACGDDTTGTPVGQASNTPSTSLPPFNGKTLQFGEVAQVDSADGAQMQPIANGMIRSRQTTVKIVELGTADQVNDSGSGDSYRAAAGGKLLAFTVSVATDEGAEGVSDKVVADVNVDGTQRTLPDFFGDGSSSSTSEGTQLHYVVAVAQNRRAVDLELKASGLVQSFDLLGAHPKGDQPAALYRSTSGTTVNQEALAPTSYKVDVYSSSSTDDVNEITVQQAELGYFGGKDGALPSNPANGWLSFAINEDGPSGEATTCVTPLTGYTLKDAAGKEYKASATASSVPSEPELLGDTQSVVAFEVPADFAQGTLIIGPKTAVCEVSTSSFEPRPVHSKATVAITLPAN